MAAGNITASDAQVDAALQRPVQNAGAEAVVGLAGAFNDLARSGMAYASSRQDLARVYDRRAAASRGLDLETQFLDYQRRNAEEFTRMARDMSGNPADFTDAYDKYLDQSGKDFLKTVDARFLKEYEAKIAQDRTQRRGGAFTTQLQMMDTRDSTLLTQNLNTLGTALKAGQTTLEDANLNWNEIVDKSALSSAAKEQLKLNGGATLAQLQFGTELESAALGRGVADGAVPDGSDTVAAGLTAHERATLNTIAAKESPAYDVWNGGSKFVGYADHPAARNDAPGESTAAGRYQFTLGTWRNASAAYERSTGAKVPDFSPEWQDRVALFWAEKRFNELNTKGLTFRGAITSGDPEQLLEIKRTLGDPRGGNANAVEWAGLGSSSMSDQEFLALFSGEKGIAGGGTGASTGPNVWADPRFANIGLDDKVRLGASVQAQYAAMQRQQREARNAAEAELKRSVYASGYEASDYGIIDAMKAQFGERFTPQIEEEARRGIADGMNRVHTERETADRLAAGQVMTKRDDKSLSMWLGQDAVRGIEEGDQASYDKLAYAVQQGRFIPTDAMNALVAASRAPQTRNQALTFLASLNAGDSTVLTRSGFDPEVIAQAEVYGRLAGQTDPETMAKQWDALQNRIAQLGLSPTQSRKEALKAFTENYSAGAIVSEAFGGWFKSPSLPDTMKDGLMLDAATYFQDGWMLTGDEKGAETYMKKALQRDYGASAIGDSETLMKYPPEKFGYPTFSGSTNAYKRSIVSFAQAGIPETAGIRVTRTKLVADEQTAEEAKAGQPPTYKVMASDLWGQQRIVPGRWGGKQVTDAVEQEYIGKLDASATGNAQTATVTSAVDWVRSAKSKLLEAQGSGMPATDPESFKLLSDDLTNAGRNLNGLAIDGLVDKTYAESVVNGTKEFDVAAQRNAAQELIAKLPDMRGELRALALDRVRTGQSRTGEEASSAVIGDYIAKSLGVSPSEAQAIVESYGLQEFLK